MYKMHTPGRKKTREVQDNWRSVWNNETQLINYNDLNNRLKTVMACLLVGCSSTTISVALLFRFPKAITKKNGNHSHEQWFHCWKKEVGSIGPSTVWEAITWNTTCSCKKMGSIDGKDMDSKHHKRVNPYLCGLQAHIICSIYCYIYTAYVQLTRIPHINKLRRTLCSDEMQWCGVIVDVIQDVTKCLARFRRHAAVSGINRYLVVFL